MTVPIGQETIIIGHGPAVMVTTNFTHPIHELDGGPHNTYLARTLMRYCTSKQIPPFLEYVCERRAGNGTYIQYWLPIETPLDADG